MSRNSILVGLGVCMLALVVIMGFLFREPVDTKALLETGHVVTGSLDPSSPPLPGALPPVEAFVMSGGQLPVTTIGDAAPTPSTVASVVSDAPASSSQMVTAPPSSSVSLAPGTSSGSGSAQAGTSGTGTASASSGTAGSSSSSANLSNNSAAPTAPSTGSTATTPPTVDPSVYAVSRTYGAGSSRVNANSTNSSSTVQVFAQEAAETAAPMVETIVVEDPALARNKPVVSSSSAVVSTTATPAPTPPSSNGTVTKPGSVEVISNATIRSEPNPDDSKKAAFAKQGQAAPANQPTKVEPKPASEKPSKAEVLTTVAKATPKAGLPTVTKATLTMDGETVLLRLQADAPISGKAFLLYKPNRAVLDLPGAWNVPLPRVPSNRMVSDMRVGKQESGLRLVMDMRVKPNGVSVKQIDAQTIELRVK